MKKQIIFISTVILLVILLIFLFPNTGRNILSDTDKRLSIFYNNKQNEDSFENLIDSLKSKTGTYSIYINDLGNNEIYKYNEDYPVYAASLYKTPIAVAVLKCIEDGIFSLEDNKSYLPIDFSTGTGRINQYPYGQNFTILQLLNFLLKDSDNSVQNIFLRIIPQEIIESTFKISGELNYFYHINVASPKQIAEFFELLLKTNYINDEHKKILFDIMSKTSFDDRINKGLDENLIFAHKIGNWGNTGSWHDCGIIFKEKPKAIVCLMSENTNYEDFSDASREVGQFLSNIINR